MAHQVGDGRRASFLSQQSIAQIAAYVSYTAVALSSKEH